MKCSLQNSSKVVVFVFLLQMLLCVSSFCQKSSLFIQKGHLEFGGNIGFTYTSYKDDENYKDQTSTNLLINPSIGYFLFDGLQIGFYPFGYTNQVDKYTYQSSYSNQKREITASASNICLFIAKYFDMNRNYYPYLQIQYGIVSGKSKSNSYTSSISGNSFDAVAGMKIEVVKNCLINFGLDYKIMSLTNNYSSGENKYNQIGFTSGISIWF
jgi:hypothetical protein